MILKMRFTMQNKNLLISLLLFIAINCQKTLLCKESRFLVFPETDTTATFIISRSEQQIPYSTNARKTCTELLGVKRQYDKKHRNFFSKSGYYDVNGFQYFSLDTAVAVISFFDSDSIGRHGRLKLIAKHNGNFCIKAISVDTSFIAAMKVFNGQILQNTGGCTNMHK
jgi:hypothetical protein